MHKYLLILISGSLLLASACDSDTPSTLGPSVEIVPEPVWEGPPILYVHHNSDRGFEEQPALYGNRLLTYHYHRDNDTANIYTYRLLHDVSSKTVVDSVVIGTLSPHGVVADPREPARAVVYTGRAVEAFDLQSGARTVAPLAGAVTEGMDDGNLYLQDVLDDCVTVTLSVLDAEGLVATPVLERYIDKGDWAAGFSNIKLVEGENGPTLYGEFSYYDAKNRSSKGTLFAFDMTDRQFIWETEIVQRNGFEPTKVAFESSGILLSYTESVSRLSYETGEAQVRWEATAGTKVNMAAGTYIVTPEATFFYANESDYGDGSGGIYELSASTLEPTRVIEGVINLNGLDRSVPYRSGYILSEGSRVLRYFDPVARTLSAGIEPPRLFGYDSVQWLREFSVDEKQGWLVAGDYETTYVFDINGWW